jgi:hypothetical protein
VQTLCASGAPAKVFLARSRAARYHSVSSGFILPKLFPKLFPCALLACNVGAAVCSAAAGDFRRSLYWAASALCIGAITF